MNHCIDQPNNDSLDINYYDDPEAQTNENVEIPIKMITSQDLDPTYGKNPKGKYL